ncbi:MAG: purine-nucleoside phosphorylase [Cyclonatronaceae bacterium]
MKATELRKALEYLNEMGITRAETGVILGSGLGDFAAQLDEINDIPYHQIPGMPGVSVEGHSGALYAGKIDGISVVAFGGRFHSYEGYGLETTLTPVQIAHGLGVKKLIISNAAGAVSHRLRTGDLMFISDFMSPGYDFALPDLQRSFVRFDNYHLRERVLALAAGLGIALQHGTYFYVKGPTYETKAEVRAYRNMGADVVGMSTAPELLEARRRGICAIGLSMVTNMATGVSKARLDHNEVKETAMSRKDDFARLVKALITADLSDAVPEAAVATPQFQSIK